MNEAADDLVLAEWGFSQRPRRLRLKLMGAAVLVALAAVAAGMVALATRSIAGSGVSTIVTSGVTIIVLTGLGLWWWSIQERMALRSSGAIPLAAGSEPRLENIVQGLARDLGVAPPALFVVPGGPNALVSGGGGVGALALARALLDHYTRTELEAVVAHSLVRLSDRAALADARIAVALGGRGTSRQIIVGADDDLRAVALTRYPPALATAIEKAEPRRGRFSPLWFVARHPSHNPAQVRADALRQL